MTEPRPLSDFTLVYREIDRLDARVTSVDGRVTALDEHGSRGLEGVRVQLLELSKDLATLVEQIRYRSAHRWQVWLGVSALAVAVLVPIYLFMIQTLMGRP